MKKPKIELKPFDICFFNTILGHDQVLIKETGVYHTVVINDEKAGIVGFITTTNIKGEKMFFVQIALLNKFRGKGITKFAEDLLAEKYHLPNLYATIEKDNFASLKAHLNAGFQKIDDDKLTNIRNKGFIKANQTRLFKEYTK